MDPNVFPALAGMNQLADKIDDCLKCVPRARGDEPSYEGVDIVWVECSPRSRG